MNFGVWLGSAALAALLLDQVWTRRQRVAPRLYRPSPRLGWTLTPGISRRIEVVRNDEVVWGHEIHINAEGFNDREWTVEPAARQRVIVTGDSIIESRQVPRRQSFVAVAERMLQDESPGEYELFNAGVAGWSVDCALNFFQQRGRGFSPRAVVLGLFVGNDLLEGDYDSFKYLFRYAWDCRRYDKPAFSLRDGTLVRSNFPAWRNVGARIFSEELYQRSRTFRRAYQSVNRRLEHGLNGSRILRRKGVNYNDFIEQTKGREFFYAQTCAQIDALAESCRDAGARFGVMLEPNFPLFYPPRNDMPPAARKEYDRDVEHYREMERRVSDKYPVLGLLEPLHAANEPISFSPADPHFNAAGHQLVARELASFIRRLTA